MTMGLMRWQWAWHLSAICWGDMMLALIRALLGESELQKQRRRLHDQCARIAETELRNANARAASRLEQLDSVGTPFAQVETSSPSQSRPALHSLIPPTTSGDPFTRYEQDPIFGWLDSQWGDFLGWDLSSSVPVSAFPREMYPERPTTLRTQIAQDAIRFQSRMWFETMPFYSGPIGHLRNYICGSGMTVDVVIGCWSSCGKAKKKSKRHEQDNEIPTEAETEVEADGPSAADESLTEEMQEYLDGFNQFRRNNMHRRLWDSVLNLFRDGEDALRLFPPPAEPLAGESDVYPEIRSVDTSTIRGPHNEITGPWAYGVLTSWPNDFEDVKAYHLWKPDNTHENVSPDVLKLAKFDNTGANVKRGVPLCYTIRKQLPQMAKLLDCMAVGEAARQAIPYIRQFNTADRAAVRAATPSYLDSIDAAEAEYHNALGYSERRRGEIVPGDVPLINKGQEFQDTPQGRAESGTLAYRTLAETVACALKVPLWFITGTADQENYASSLVSESPLTKTIQHVQQIITDHFRSVYEAVIEMAVGLGQFPVDWRARVEIHCELPSPIARDPDKAVESDVKLLDKKLLSPQHLCVRNGLDFDEEQDLIEQAEAGGWQAQTEMELALAGQADDTEGGDGPPKPPKPGE